MTRWAQAVLDAQRHTGQVEYVLTRRSPGTLPAAVIAGATHRRPAAGAKGAADHPTGRRSTGPAQPGWWPAPRPDSRRPAKPARAERAPQRSAAHPHAQGSTLEPSRVEHERGSHQIEQKEAVPADVALPERTRPRTRRARKRQPPGSSGGPAQRRSRALRTRLMRWHSDGSSVRHVFTGVAHISSNTPNRTSTPQPSLSPGFRVWSPDPVGCQLGTSHGS